LLEEFDPLYHKYQRRVYRQCYRMLGNPEDAEDLTQEVFLQLFRKAHTFRGDANFSTWLYRLTVNTVLMQMRRRRRWRESVTSLDVAPGLKDELSDVLTKACALPGPATNALDRIGLDAAIAQLSSGYKEIFVLHDVEGYRHDEIAGLLGISEGTSKSQLHKARLRLRSLIGSGRDETAGFRHARPVRNIRGKRCPPFRAAQRVGA
jgi:RNA polymerase sigma-70 factor (ECF subfamily)